MTKQETKRVVLIIGGGIAAYKSLDLTRNLIRAGYAVDCVMTASAQQFVQPLSFASLSGNKVRAALFDESEEAEIDHIALSRRADFLLVAPATANLLAKMAMGQADDLATTLLLATDKPIVCAPAMNWRMWSHPATRRNITQLKQDGVFIIEPEVGTMACGEFGAGKLPEPQVIAEKAIAFVASSHTKETKTLAGKKFLLTSGATREPLDPVRFISNHSSGKQGLALAESLAARGGEVFLVEGVTTTKAPSAENIHLIKVETAREMKQACDNLLEQHTIDAAFCVAAVCDFRAKPAEQKIKKTPNQPFTVEWEENPDLLASIAQRTYEQPGGRPALVVGFAAETENLLANARAKKEKKQCDWIIANDVAPDKDVFGSDQNQAVIISADKEQALPQMTKRELAEKIVDEVELYFATTTTSTAPALTEK